MAEPVPVVTVLDNTLDGTMVRWFRTVGDAYQNRAVLRATFKGVVGQTYLTDIPDAWLAAAKGAYETLRAGGDVSRLATHRGRFGDGGGPLDPVERAEG